MPSGKNNYHLRYSPERDLFNETSFVSQELFEQRIREISETYKAHHFATWRSSCKTWKEGRDRRYKGSSYPNKGDFVHYLIQGGVVTLTPNSIILEHESKKGIKTLAQILNLPYRKRRFLNEMPEFRKNNQRQTPIRL